MTPDESRDRMVCPCCPFGHNAGMRRVNIAQPEFTRDEAHPEGFRSGMFRFGPLLGAEQIGGTIYELLSGQAICPYHYQCGEEEWLIVLTGRPTLRHAQGEDVLEPWDAVCFAPGPHGAHLVRNDTDQVVTVLMTSNLRLPGASVYPDSGKIGIWTGECYNDIIVRRESAVDCYDGETGLEPAHES